MSRRPARPCRRRAAGRLGPPEPRTAGTTRRRTAGRTDRAAPRRPRSRQTTITSERMARRRLQYQRAAEEDERERPLTLEPPGRIEADVRGRVRKREARSEIAITGRERRSIQRVVDPGDRERPGQAGHGKQRGPQHALPPAASPDDRHQPWEQRQRHQVRADENRHRGHQAGAERPCGRAANRHGQRADPERRRRNVGHREQRHEHDYGTAGHEQRRDRGRGRPENRTPELKREQDEQRPADRSDQVWAARRRFCAPAPSTSGRQARRSAPSRHPARCGSRAAPASAARRATAAPRRIPRRSSVCPRPTAPTD